MSGQAKVQGNASPIRWQLVVCPNHGAQTCGCYRCNDWQSVPVVQLSVAEALAAALVSITRVSGKAESPSAEMRTIAQRALAVYRRTCGEEGTT